MLPVGISFYTFQALGYSIDVYRGDIKAEKNFFTYALFVTFFPQLVAGPIERTKHLLPQFKVDHRFDYKRVTDGFKLASWGMFKKVVIADTLSLYVTAAFNDISFASSIALTIATLFFTIQIYCDFSGYSDIAIGISKIPGFNLMKNFNKPYFACSISDFWKRWHISLSTWFKDYLYIPLGGNKVRISRHYLNLFITFLVSGLWHGAALHFVAWGFLHSIYLILSTATNKVRRKIRLKLHFDDPLGNTKKTWKVIQIVTTFFFVNIAWVLFRANNISNAITILQKICFAPKESVFIIKALINHSLGAHYLSKYILGVGKFVILKGVLYIVLLFLVSLLTRKKSGIAIVSAFHPFTRWVLYFVFLIILVHNFIGSGQSSQFIYFQF